MKITTTTTETVTKEIEITFPCYTKVQGEFSTAFYCIKSENEIFRIEHYNAGNITTVSSYSNKLMAFKEGFEFIDKAKFFYNYDLFLAKMSDDMEQLEASLNEEEEEEKEEEQGYEYNPETQTMN